MNVFMKSPIKCSSWIEQKKNAKSLTTNALIHYAVTMPVNVWCVCVENMSPHKHTPFNQTSLLTAPFTNSMSTHVWMFVCVCVCDGACSDPQKNRGALCRLRAQWRAFICFDQTGTEKGKSNSEWTERGREGGCFHRFNEFVFCSFSQTTSPPIHHGTTFSGLLLRPAYPPSGSTFLPS